MSGLLAAAAYTGAVWLPRRGCAWLLSLGVAAVAMAAPGNADPATGDLPHRLVVPNVRTGAPREQTRTYAMGWWLLTPVPTVAALLEMMPKLAAVSEYAVIQREAPWTRILAGDHMDAIIDEEYQGLVDLLRGSGLKLVILVDPLDGLDRKKEGPELVAAGRSIMEPQIRAMHEQWVRTLVARLHPEYIGLASEINTLGARGDRAKYDVLRDMANTLAPQLRQLSPASKVFVSFQVDDAWELPPFPPTGVDQFAMARDFDIDVMGVSSYPGVSFDDPADIPVDYYRRLAVASGKPLIQVEGGWSSADTAVFGPSTPALEAAYFRRLFELLGGVNAELVALLTLADLDLASPLWTVPPDRLDALRNFASMGIVDSHLQPKLAYGEWKSVHDRPLAPAR